MASGKNHDRSIYITTPVILGVVSYFSGVEAGLITGASHLLAGLYLSPDLDLISRPYKRWGYLQHLWTPYQKLIPRHRHWSSHGIIIGSVLRLIYLGALLHFAYSITVFIAAFVPPIEFIVSKIQQVQWAGITPENFVAFFCGVELSALNHLLLDGMLLPLPQDVKNRLKG